MELKLNEKPLSNVLLLLNNMQLHAMSLFNMNQSKFVLFVNSNASVLPNTTQLLMFNNMVLHSLMPLHFFNKLDLLVLLKISHHQAVLLLVSVQQAMAKVLDSAHQASKAAALVVVLVLVLVVELHPMNHQATQHQAVETLVQLLD